MAAVGGDGDGDGSGGSICVCIQLGVLFGYEFA